MRNLAVRFFEKPSAGAHHPTKEPQRKATAVQFSINKAKQAALLTTIIFQCTSLVGAVMALNPYRSHFRWHNSRSWHKNLWRFLLFST